jgi:hypothetical protein
LSYNGRKGSSYINQTRHRHGTLKWKSDKKQWLGGNQYVNASNNYAMKETKKETKKNLKDVSVTSLSVSSPCYL